MSHAPHSQAQQNLEVAIARAANLIRTNNGAATEVVRHWRGRPDTLKQKLNRVHLPDVHQVLASTAGYLSVGVAGQVVVPPDAQRHVGDWLSLGLALTAREPWLLANPEQAFPDGLERRLGAVLRSMHENCPEVAHYLSVTASTRRLPTWLTDLAEPVPPLAAVARQPRPEPVQSAPSPTMARQLSAKTTRSGQQSGTSHRPARATVPVVESIGMGGRGPTRPY